jgi:hypothetical protein
VVRYSKKRIDLPIQNIIAFNREGLADLDYMIGQNRIDRIIICETSGRHH